MKRGFTLIVIVLAAILYPVIARTRCYESRYSCTSNLKTLALGIQMY